MDNLMHLEFDRRHAFYLDHEGHIHPICPYRLDRLWQGDPTAAIPELATRRIRFALLHTERFTSPPRVVLEHYPVLTFDAHGNLDLDTQQAQLHAEVDRLEANDYAPIAPAANTEWRPDPATRRLLLAATRTPARHPAPTRRSPTAPAAIPAPAVVAPRIPSPVRVSSPVAERSATLPFVHER